VANARYVVGVAGGRTFVDPEELTDDDLLATADHVAAIENPERRRDAILEALTTHRLLARNNNKLAREFLEFVAPAARVQMGTAENSP
jgi:hypothetical protein